MDAKLPHAGATRTWATFLALAVALVLTVVGHPLFSGRAYSQADILFTEYPWAAHRPPGFDAPANPLLGDIPMLMYPALAFARDRVVRGEFPTWNPYLFGGQPFIGATQTAVFSPFTAIAYVVALPDALTWIYMSRVLLGGLGMFAFLGSLGVGGGARVFGALAWMLTPFTIVWLAHPLSEIAGWLPWMVMATRYTCQRGTGRDVAGLALVTALSLAAGHPETTLKTLLLSGALALVFAFERRSEGSPGLAAASPARALGRAAAGVILGLVLAGIQVVPSLEYLAESEALAGREGGGPSIYVVPPETLVTAVVPNFLGHPTDGTFLPMENRFGLASNYAEQQAYAGIAVWLLAAIGAWHRRRAAVERAVAGLCVLAALIMYGAPGLSTIVAHVPGLSIVVLSRFGIAIAFGAVWLAAVGLDALLRHPRTVGVAPAVAASLAAAALVAASLAFFYPVLVARGQLGNTLQWISFAAGLALVTTGVAWLRQRERLSAAWCASILTAVLLVDLAVFARGFHPAIDRSFVFPDLAEVQAVTADRGLYRVAGWRHAMLPNAATVYGLSDYRGYDGIAPRRWGAMLDAALPRDGGQFRQFTDPAALRLLRLLNVRYVFSDPAADLSPFGLTRLNTGPAPVWRDDAAFPRAFLADRYEIVAGGADLLTRLRDERLDLRRTVLLEEQPEPALPRPSATSPPASEDRADVRHYRDAFVEIHTSAKQARVLVLGDNHFPGWTVTVDGRPARLLRADGALRAVSLAPGPHVVQFSYAPASIRLGAASTAVAGLVVVVLVRRRSRPPG